MKNNDKVVADNNIKELEKIGFENSEKMDNEPIILPHQSINHKVNVDPINTLISTTVNSSATEESKHSLSNTSKCSPIGPHRENKSCAREVDNGKNPVVSEDDSMSIADSTSTASKFEQIEQTEKQGTHEFGKPPLRPPPGLAPPPGFTNSDKLQISTADQEFTTQPASNSSTVLAYNPILSNLLYDQEDVESPDDELLVAKEDQRGVDNDDKVLLGLGEDFDVMNFFSFLDEGVQKERRNSNGSIEDGNYSSMLYETKNKTVQANPWSGTQRPRALAYGIEVEVGNGREADRGQNDIQLLTPSMILGQDLNVGENEDDKNEVDREDLIFNFSRLLED